MKNLIKGALFLALVGTVMVGCEKEDLNISKKENKNCANDSQRENSFDYDVFNQRGKLFSILEKIDLSPVYHQNIETINYEPLENALDSINDSLGTNLSVTSFDMYQVENQDKNLSDYLNEGFLSQQEHDILAVFLTDIEIYSFEQSIENLENHINSLNLNSDDFDKYNDFVNVLMIIDDYYVEQGINIFSSVGRPEISAGCATAIASNAVATLSLNSCFVPGPWCAVAVAGKALSLAGIYFSC